MEEQTMTIFLKRDKWLFIGGFFVLFGSLFCGYHFYDSWKAFSVITFPIPDCDLYHGPCISTLPTGERIELHIKPTQMPVLTLIQLDVKTEKISPKKISIFFKGADMNMGEFSYTLALQKDGSYSARTILPTCIQDQMVWHAVIEIEARNKRYHAPFALINQKPSRS